MKQPDLFGGVPDITPPGERNDGDAYFTPHFATRALIDYLGGFEPGHGRLVGRDGSPVRIWEPCAGAGHIRDQLVRAIPSADVVASDVYPRAPGIFTADFLGSLDFLAKAFGRFDWIVTNTPYTLDDPKHGKVTAADFVRRALEVCDRVAVLLRVAWLEPANDRFALYLDEPPTDYVVLPRVNYIGAPDGNNQTSIWYVFDKLARLELGRAPHRGHYAAVHHYGPEIRDLNYRFPNEERNPRCL